MGKIFAVHIEVEVKSLFNKYYWTVGKTIYTATVFPREFNDWVHLLPLFNSWRVGKASTLSALLTFRGWISHCFSLALLILVRALEKLFPQLGNFSNFSWHFSHVPFVDFVIILLKASPFNKQTGIECFPFLRNELFCFLFSVGIQRKV